LTPRLSCGELHHNRMELRQSPPRSTVASTVGDHATKPPDSFSQLEDAAVTVAELQVRSCRSTRHEREARGARCNTPVDEVLACLGLRACRERVGFPEACAVPVPVESNRASPPVQAARGWSHPTERHFKNQSCCYLASAFDFPTLVLADLGGESLRGATGGVRTSAGAAGQTQPGTLRP
jgi:hypothetical protein